MMILADARSLPLVDRCVQCVVTSPPYFGLRDYGTAQWVGGDPTCAHVGMVERTAPAGSDKQASNRGAVSVRSGNCACGAVRVDAQIGLEATPDDYVAALVGVFREVWRVLADDGVAWLNLGDSYNSGTQFNHHSSGLDGGGRYSEGARGEWPGHRPTVVGLKTKDLLGIPWRVAFALQADGWYLRSDVIWSKPNPMPESVTDRPTKAHEYVFLLAKSERYYYDADAIRERGAYRERFGNSRTVAKAINPDRNDSDRRDMRIVEFPNRRSVWTIATMPYAGAHFATMPEALVTPCVLAGSRLGDRVLDPFAGSGTTLAVADRLGRRAVGVDLNVSYHALAKERTAQRGLRFEAVT